MDVATELARKAKELVAGMRERVKREPDVADYRAAFLPILKAWREVRRGERC